MRFHVKIHILGVSWKIGKFGNTEPALPHGKLAEAELAWLIYYVTFLAPVGSQASNPWSTGKVAGVRN